MDKNIGIFWIFENKIFSETQKINDIKTINGFKDSDLSHYQVWNKIRNQHPKFYLYEYEDIPRGRVVYNVSKNKFVIYCNENIPQDETLKRLILEKFQLLNEKSVFQEDEHYKIF
jgi:hypothetical protein